MAQKEITQLQPWERALWEDFFWRGHDSLLRMILHVQCHPGLSLISRENGEVLAASLGWDTLGIPAKSLVEQGWTAWLTRVVSGDSIEDIVRPGRWGTTENNGVITEYRLADGGSVLLRWVVAPWEQESLALSVAEVVRERADV